MGLFEAKGERQRQGILLKQKGTDRMVPEWNKRVIANYLLTTLY